jgi:hypothetical protein
MSDLLAMARDRLAALRDGENAHVPECELSEASELSPAESLDTGCELSELTPPSDLLAAWQEVGARVRVEVGSAATQTLMARWLGLYDAMVAQGFDPLGLDKLEAIPTGDAI